MISSSISAGGLGAVPPEQTISNSRLTKQENGCYENERADRAGLKFKVEELVKVEETAS